jgi:hypothetical protein
MQKSSAALSELTVQMRAAEDFSQRMCLCAGMPCQTCCAMYPVCQMPPRSKAAAGAAASAAASAVSAAAASASATPDVGVVDEEPSRPSTPIADAADSSVAATPDRPRAVVGAAPVSAPGAPRAVKRCNKVLPHACRVVLPAACGEHLLTACPCSVL